MSDRDDIRRLRDAVEGVRLGIAIQEEILDAEVQRIDQKIDAGLAEVNQSIQILIDFSKAQSRRISEIEDGNN